MKAALHYLDVIKKTPNGKLLFFNKAINYLNIIMKAVLDLPLGTILKANHAPDLLLQPSLGFHGTIPKADHVINVLLHYNRTSIIHVIMSMGSTGNSQD